MDARTEKVLYRAGAPIPIARRRELGVCKWGHPFYVAEDINGKLDYSGENVARSGMSANGSLLTYCKACHRAEVKFSDARMKERRRGCLR